MSQFHIAASLPCSVVSGAYPMAKRMPVSAVADALDGSRVKAQKSLKISRAGPRLRWRALAEPTDGPARKWVVDPKL